MGTETQQLAEYNALRSEILMHFSRRATRLTVCWTGLSLVFAGAAAAKIPDLTFISILIASSAWIDDSRGLVNICRLGSYIRFYLEPKLLGLNWETALNQVLTTSGEYSGISGRIHLVSSTYFLTVIVSIVGTIVFHISMVRKLPLLFTIILLYVSLLTVAFALNRVANLKKRKTEYDAKFSQYAGVYIQSIEKGDNQIEVDQTAG